jgi:hypothetical protein
MLAQHPDPTVDHVLGEKNVRHHPVTDITKSLW